MKKFTPAFDEFAPAFGKIRRLFRQNQRGSEMKLPGIIFDSRYL